LLNKLLGKKELKERITLLEGQIEQLRSQNESLLARQASKEETARRAVSQKQIVEQELNTAKKKIETLEYEISTLRKDASGELTFRNISSIPGRSMDNYIFEISSIKTQNSSLITIYLKQAETLSSLKDHDELPELLGPETNHLLNRIESPAGIIIFYDTGGMVREAIVPFLPVGASYCQKNTQFNVEPIQELMEQQVNLCLIIAHAGESFIAITDSPELFSHHRIVRSSVKAKHTKGGWSQRRFERLRDEDIRHHIEKVRNALELMLEDSGRAIDYIIASGEIKLVSEIIKDLDYQVIERQFDVSVDKSNISRILKEVWSSRRYEI